MKRQLGMSLMGFLLLAALLGVAALVGFRLIPAYIEYFKIKSALSAIVRDGEMKDAGPQAIRSAFDKRAQVDDIEAVNGKDIEINREGGQLVLSTNYSKCVPLAGNASVCLDFDVSTTR
jgi:hypothetical protein